MQASTHSPLSPRVFFLSSFLRPNSPFLSPHINAGRRLTFFQFKSAFKYLLNELTSFWSSFDIELFIHYLSFFVISLFKYLLIHFLNKKFNEISAPNAREKFQNNMTALVTSILSRFVRLGSFPFCPPQAHHLLSF